MRLLPWSFLCILGGLPAAEDAHLEAHGFASFGHLHSWGNNWLGPTREGSNEFWETALNTTARPVDRLRLGAQVFARDLGGYDNGKAQLDLLYADYRFTDALGIQGGRFKMPIGLFNEELDVDAARTPIFQPPYVYALRARDLFISTDGAKAYGTAGDVDYAAFVGHKHLDTEGGITTLFRQTSLPVAVDHLEYGFVAGGMGHWRTPVEGLAVRLTLADLHGLEIHGDLPGTGASVISRTEDFLYGVASVAYETADFTWLLEVSKSHARYRTTFTPAVVDESTTADHTEGAYLSATWHARRWLDLYAAVEETVEDPADRTRNCVYTTIVAVAARPLVNWSVKAELRDNHGSKGAYEFDNPEGLEKRWQVLALKTTVDF